MILPLIITVYHETLKCVNTPSKFTEAELHCETLYKTLVGSLLDQLSGVNVGLMRFNNGESSAVIYPTESIDQKASPWIYQNVKNRGDDAED